MIRVSEKYRKELNSYKVSNIRVPINCVTTKMCIKKCYKKKVYLRTVGKGAGATDLLALFLMLMILGITA